MSPFSILDFLNFAQIFLQQVSETVIICKLRLVVFQIALKPCPISTPHPAVGHGLYIRLSYAWVFPRCAPISFICHLVDLCILVYGCNISIRMTFVSLIYSCTIINMNIKVIHKLIFAIKIYHWNCVSTYKHWFLRGKYKCMETDGYVFWCLQYSLQTYIGFRTLYSDGQILSTSCALGVPTDGTGKIWRE